MSIFNDRKEEMEGKHIAFFLSLYNEAQGTDYEVGEIEPQNSLVDRKAISASKDFPDLNIQLKSIKKRDTSALTQSIMGKKTLVFNNNIFVLLDEVFEKLKVFDGRDSILILETGVPIDWVKDYVPSEGLLESITFDQVYCFGLPTSLNQKGFLYRFK